MFVFVLPDSTHLIHLIIVNKIGVECSIRCVGKADYMLKSSLIILSFPLSDIDLPV